MKSADNFRAALAELEVFVSTPVLSNRDRAGVIQGFEFTFEQAEPSWLQMISDRNRTSHVYHGLIAAEILLRISPLYPEMFKGLLTSLTQTEV